MYADVYLVNTRKDPVAFPEHWMSTLPHPPPKGYVEFLETLGYGEYCDFLTVFDPTRIVEMLEDTRVSVETLLNFIRQMEGLPDVNLADLMPIACTKDGDFVVTSAGSPDQLIGVPRQNFGLYSLPDGFSDLLNWSRFGKSRSEYVYQPPFRYFTSFLDRLSVSLFSKGAHALQDVARVLENELIHCEIRRIEHDGIVLLFARAIDGRIQLTQLPGDTRMGIEFTFESGRKNAILQIEGKLVALDFYVTGRT